MRGAPACPRCDADLEPLYRLATRAHALRSQAVDAIYRRDLAECTRLAQAAQEVHATPAGARLAWLGSMLARLR
jgi:hypothetical protein